MKKKDKNYFMRLLSFLFLIFISLYIALESGYYEAKVSKKTAMTEESIQKFEKDVKEGNPIDVNTYIFEEKNDYSNHTTDAAVFIGAKVEGFMSKGITEIFGVVKSLFS